jgi:uroporphyrinogen decarboxylase
MDTARERFMRTLDFMVSDPPFVRFGAEYVWEETIELWRQQGYDGRPLEQVFGTDTLIDLGVNYGPAPEFSRQVLAEDVRTVTYVNHEGIVVREFKGHHMASMPQFVRFPVETEADFARLAGERLGLNVEERFSDEWKGKLPAWKDSEQPRRCWANRWGGFFGALRNLMGLEGLCVAIYEQPRLVERMMAERAEAIITVTDEVLRHSDFETFWFWEDMAYNHGSLVDPRLFRRLALPHYRRVCDWLRSRGIRHIWLDSDGDIRELIPVWLEGGINGLWPFEVQAGMDVVQVRREYGHDLALAGGIDKRAVAQGGGAMRSEVERVMPLVADGGYLPELDHGVPPDISWPNYREYMGYLLQRLQRG